MKNKEGKAMSYYPQTIADKMEKGLTKEIEMYAAISKALREDGNSKSQVSYYMSVDEDFIPDVLQAYASIVTAPNGYENHQGDGPRGFDFWQDTKWCC